MVKRSDGSKGILCKPSNRPRGAGRDSKGDAASKTNNLNNMIEEDDDDDQQQQGDLFDEQSSLRQNKKSKRKSAKKATTRAHTSFADPTIEIFLEAVRCDLNRNETFKAYFPDQQQSDFSYLKHTFADESESWKLRHEECEKFRKQYCELVLSKPQVNAFDSSSFTEEEKVKIRKSLPSRLLQWEILQMTDHELDRMEKEDVDKLEALPGWSWTALPQKADGKAKGVQLSFATLDDELDDEMEEEDGFADVAHDLDLVSPRESGKDENQNGQALLPSFFDPDEANKELWAGSLPVRDQNELGTSNNLLEGINGNTGGAEHPVEQEVPRLEVADEKLAGDGDVVCGKMCFEDELADEMKPDVGETNNQPALAIEPSSAKKDTTAEKLLPDSPEVSKNKETDKRRNNAVESSEKKRRKRDKEKMMENLLDLLKKKNLDHLVGEEELRNCMPEFENDGENARGDGHEHSVAVAERAASPAARRARREDPSSSTQNPNAVPAGNVEDNTTAGKKCKASLVSRQSSTSTKDHATSAQVGGVLPRLDPFEKPTSDADPLLAARGGRSAASAQLTIGTTSTGVHSGLGSNAGTSASGARLTHQAAGEHGNFKAVVTDSPREQRPGLEKEMQHKSGADSAYSCSKEGGEKQKVPTAGGQPELSDVDRWTETPTSFIRWHTVGRACLFVPEEVCGGDAVDASKLSGRRVTYYRFLNKSPTAGEPALFELRDQWRGGKGDPRRNLLSGRDRWVGRTVFEKKTAEGQGTPASTFRAPLQVKAPASTHSTTQDPTSTTHRPASLSLVKQPRKRSQAAKRAAKEEVGPGNSLLPVDGFYYDGIKSPTDWDFSGLYYGLQPAAAAKSRP
ncbi:unnamed protein product [Amoebophrya sp. A120]|nr:unnamed protein product [Amoebophrya sp. A120]|eukprot:GSA120T00010807001.1